MGDLHVYMIYDYLYTTLTRNIRLLEEREKVVGLGYRDLRKHTHTAVRDNTRKREKDLRDQSGDKSETTTDKVSENRSLVPDWLQL